MGSRYRNKATVLLLGCALVISGCNNIFKKPVGDFNKATDKAARVAEIYLSGMNAVEKRKHGLEELVGTNIDFRKNKYKAFFPEKGIRARLDCIQLLKNYALHLAAIAGADTGKKLDESVKKLGSNLGSLGSTIEQIDMDNSISKYTGPVSEVVGYFLEKGEGMVRERALKKAITRGAPAIKKIITLLKSDVTMAYRARQEAVGLMYSRLRRYKRKNWDKLDHSARKEVQAMLNSLESERKALEKDPSAVFAAMEKVHEKMLNAVQEPKPDKQKRSFKEFKASVREFYSETERVLKLAEGFKKNG